jgi:hypothetical protein
MYNRYASLGHASLAGTYLLWECPSRRASLTGMYLIGVQLIGVPLMGVQLPPRGRVPHGRTSHGRVLFGRVYVSKSKKALGKPPDLH